MNGMRIVEEAGMLNYNMPGPTPDEGMLSVICIDGESMAVEGLRALRMVAYATELAVAKTLETSRATFWSRSRQSLWTKGEESGNFLLIRGAYTDCDADSLLLDVEAMGPTCHTGAETCFVDPSAPGAVETALVADRTKTLGGWLASLDTIAGRADRMAAGEEPGTYTERLLADQNKRVQKLGTEAVELVREECRPDYDEDRFIGEAADAMYALEVICAARGVAFTRVLQELADRNQAAQRQTGL